MNNHIVVILNILGSLAIFLYAMKILSNNLQNVIGERIEYILRKLTNRPLKGMLVGSFVTFLTQSSSITVLTLIGLVNVGVLNLQQGVGIILGSEIGTTITAQLVTFDVSMLFLPMILIGFILDHFGKNKKLCSWGKVLFCFGLLFMGIELIKQGASPLKESQAALSVFESFGTNLILGIIVGALFTGITSSSSATTSLTVALGASNVITLPAGIALMLGANVGTCILELVAVTGMSLTAKRVAVAQALINVLGVIIIFPFIGSFSELMSLTSSSLSRQIANSHTVFNVASSFSFLFITGLIVKVAKKLVPGKLVKIRRGVKYIDPKILEMPHIAVVNATKEVKRAGKVVISMLDCVREALIEERFDLINVIYAQEDQIDFLNEEISRYLTMISQKELGSETSERIAQLLHGISDIERASDHVNRIAEQIELKRKKKMNFSSRSRKEITVFLDNCTLLFEKSLDAFLMIKPRKASRVFREFRDIKDRQNKLKGRINHWTKKKREVYFSILHNLERVANHGNNIAQIAVTGF